ncbi:MAG: hypothetical protein EOP45_05835 [Sphingobacteriaceae bacterium]|nr:MAG: hypothetical protein EOP45_05835 [Sphingobacteriaceae bacterium]
MQIRGIITGEVRSDYNGLLELPQDYPFGSCPMCKKGALALGATAVYEKGRLTRISKFSNFTNGWNIHFNSCHIKIQEANNDNEYIIATVGFDIKRVSDSDAKDYLSLETRIRQPTGKGFSFETAALEIALPPELTGKVSYNEFRYLTDLYYRSVVGENASVINTMLTDRAPIELKNIMIDNFLAGALLNAHEDEVKLNTGELALNFNRLFLDKWGLHKVDFDDNYGIDVGFYHDSLVQLLQWAERYKVIRDPPPVVCAFTNSTSINASVIRKDGIYYAGFNIGVVYLLDRLFNTMLSNPNVLKNIGTSSSENNTTKWNRKYFKDMANFSKENLPLNYTKPKDPVRVVIAEFLTYLSLSFLAFHEYAHILNGHIGYRDSVQGVNSITESRLSLDKGKARKKFILEQTLEYDADSTAAFDIINFIFHYDQNFFFLPTKFRKIVQNSEKSIALVAFACNSIFEIFGDDSLESEILMERKHPSFDMRRKLLYNTSLHHIYHKMKKGRFDIEVASKLQNYIKAGVELCDKAFLAIGEEGDVSLAKDFNEKNQRHLEILYENWHRLMPDIKKYSYVKLIE